MYRFGLTLLALWVVCVAATAFIARGVARVSASAFMQLSPEVVRFAAHGLSRDAQGNIRRATHVFAKVSRSTARSRPAA